MTDSGVSAQSPRSPGLEEATGALSTRARDVRARVAAAAVRGGRAPDAVRIVAVSKTVPADMIRAAYALGFTTFGENRVQEARDKIAALRLPHIRWEMIGHLQTNKAARAVELFERVQSVDSLRLAEALDAQAATHGRTLPILLEVNVGREPTKTGFAPEEVPDAARAVHALSHLRIEGLMTIAPPADDPETVRPIFQQLRALRDDLRRQVPTGDDGGWHELSMGMTDDFEVAIEEGATLVRIGRALFGSRPTP